MRSYEMQRDFLLDWIEMINRGGDLYNCLQRKGIEHIIIYGFGHIGMMAYNVLKDKMVIDYGIDNSVISIDDRIEIKRLDEITTIPDLKKYTIVITVIDAYSDVYDSLLNTIGHEISVCSIEDVLYEEILHLS